MKSYLCELFMGEDLQTPRDIMQKALNEYNKDLTTLFVLGLG